MTTPFCRRILLAPSGAGKTHLSLLGAVIDGERLPAVHAAYRHLDSKFGSSWWCDPEYKTRIKPIKDETLVTAYAFEIPRQAPGIPIALADIDVVKHFLNSGELKPHNVRIWIPAAPILTLRQSLREATSHKPRLTETENISYRRRYLVFATRYGLDVTAKAELQVPFPQPTGR